jgi:hypothetical protein
MNHIKSFLKCAVVLSLACCFSAPEAWGYRVTSAVIGDCGLKAVASGSGLDFTAGEEAVGLFSGSGYRVQGGFWYAVGASTGPDTVPPSTPLLVRPLNISWTTNQMVNFGWEEATDASGISRYEFRVAVTSGFASSVADNQVASTFTSISLNYGRYYWSVRAFDNHDNAGSWTSPWLVLVSSRPWTLYVDPGPGELVADLQQALPVSVRFIEPIGSTQALNGYNYPVSLSVYCGSAVRRSSTVVTVNGGVLYNYRDDIAGKMTVQIQYGGVSAAATIKNLVPSNRLTTVWCAGDNGATRLDCPAGTFSANAWVEITPVSGEIVLPSGNILRALEGSGRDIAASVGGIALGKNDFPPGTNMTLRLPYNEQGGLIGGIIMDENILTVCRLENGTPSQLLTIVDAANNRASASIGYVSRYFLGWIQPPVTKLYPNFPNPFILGSESTCVMYDLTSGAKVNLKIFNLSGELIRILKKDADESAGQYKVLWDGKNQSGKDVTQGIYVCSLETSKGAAKSVKIIAKKATQ